MATRLEHSLIAWHNRNYGEGVNVPATFRKLLEEVGELGEALLLSDREKIWEEAGDVGVLLFHVLRGACPNDTAVSPASLAVAMALALQKCEQREAAKAAEGGDAFVAAARFQARHREARAAEAAEEK